MVPMTLAISSHNVISARNTRNFMALRRIVSPLPTDKVFVLFYRKYLETLNSCRGRGGGMTYGEFEKLNLLADRMIGSCSPRKADYGRGYLSGIKYNFYNPQSESSTDHYLITEMARSCGCRNVHAYVCGYRDGCKGLKPEDSG